MPQPDASPASIDALPSRLRAIPLATRWKMQQRCLEVFHSHFRNLHLHTAAMTNLFISRYQDAYVNSHRASYDHPALRKRQPFSCVPGHGSAMHCAHAVADAIDMNTDTSFSSDVARQELMSTGLMHGMKALSAGNAIGAVLSWRRWATDILMDAAADRTVMIQTHALVVGAAFINAAAVLHEKGK